MTNPDNIVRVRARLDGRASVYEANGWAQAYSQGLLSGNGVLPNTIPDMNVLVGGTPSNPDVVIAENPDGYKIALDIVGQQAIAITAPASQSRISAIVAYTDDLSLASTDSTTTGSPSSCGLIVVNGSASANPTEPSDSTIRTAITSDGATGSQASYCVLATILVSSATTEISSSLIDSRTTKLSVNDAIISDNIDYPTMKKWVPDYANTQTVGTPLDFTAPSDGFFSYGYGKYSSNNDTTITIKVDNVVVAKQTSNTTDPGGYKICTLNGMMPISSGQRVISDASGDMNNSVYFIPGKWA